MITRNTSSVLGVALGRTRLRVAQMRIRGGRQSVDAAEEFVYPEGLSLETPEKLGRALRALLRQRGITTRRAVLGLPAEWLMTRVKSVPPAPRDVAASALRLQAESEFSSEPNDLMVDFAGTTSETAASTVLLVATARQYADAAQAFARAANLKVVRLGATALSLGAFTRSIGNTAGLVVSLTDDGAEMLLEQDGRPAQIRHYSLGSAADDPGEFAGEVRRTSASMGRKGTPLQLALWRDAVTGRLPAAFSERLGIPMSLPVINGALPGAAPGAQRCVDAVALAMAHLTEAAPAVDFLHSRLAPPKPPSRRRRIAWASAIAAIIVVALALLWTDSLQKQRELKVLQTRYAGYKDNLAKADKSLKRLATASAWTASTPRTLACLRDLTALFPDEGNSIWVTTFTLTSDGKGQLTGKAVSTQQVLAFLDRMKDAKRFSDPKLMDRRDVSRSGPEIAFSISFVYRGQE